MNVDEYIELLKQRVKAGAEITLEELRMFNSKFVCPQMYYYLDNYPELFDFIKNHASELDEVIEHDFTYINKDDICRRKYKEV